MAAWEGMPFFLFFSRRRGEGGVLFPGAGCVVNVPHCRYDEKGYKAGKTVMNGVIWFFLPQAHGDYGKKNIKQSGDALIEIGF